MHAGGEQRLLLSGMHNMNQCELWGNSFGTGAINIICFAPSHSYIIYMHTTDQQPLFTSSMRNLIYFFF